MASGEPGRVDARTDVYLLGATLFEILTGRMIHEAPTALAALASALSGELPPMPEGTPRDLAALVHRACAAEPDKRLPSAEAFRGGLERYLATRHADALVADARLALDRAASALEGAGPTSPDALRAIIEARFGLTSAMKMHPGDSAVRAEHDRAVRLAIEREVALRSPGAARALFEDLAVVPADLVATVESLERELDAERRAAEALDASRREADATAAVRPLTLVAIVGILIGTSVGAWFVIDAARADEHFPIRVAVALDAIAVVVACGGFYLGRRALLRTAGTRRLAWTYATWGWSMVLSDVVTYALGHDAAEAAAHAMLAGGCFTACAAIYLRELAVCVAVHAVAVIGILSAPTYSAAFAMSALICDAVIFVHAFRREGARSALSSRPSRAGV